VSPGTARTCRPESSAIPEGSNATPLTLLDVQATRSRSRTVVALAADSGGVPRLVTFSQLSDGDGMWSQLG
jgi:hypothetical protein